MSTVKSVALTLGVHPGSHGFGWVAFEAPFSIYDFGLAAARGDKNVICLRKFKKLVQKLEPHTLVLENFERKVHQRVDRVVRLCRAFVAHAVEQGIEVVIYSKGEIQNCFASVGARSRHEIAGTIAGQFESLRHRLPSQRKAWESEDWRMSLFNATASVLTHFQLGASKLFDDLHL